MSTETKSTDTETTGADAALLARARGIRVSFGGPQVLADVDLTVSRGEVVSLVGPNGSGKTTLLRALLGLIRPDAGTVWLRPGIRVGYMPQRLTVEPVLPLSVRRFLELARRCSPARIERVLDEVGAKHAVDYPLQTLSGGELQRVLLARALVREPDLLVLDEPVQGVDLSGQAELYGLIGRIRLERTCGVLMVSHDLNLVMAATDEVICLNHHVCCAGRPETVSRHPEYIALFGPQIARSLAVYAHDHDHVHDLSGRVVPAGPDETPSNDQGENRHG